MLKALRKDPEHRYGSVEGMADDLKRFLEGRPVSARSGSRSYRAARFLSRHRWVTLSFLVFLLFAGTFAVASALLWQRAVVERARTHRVMSFMKEAIRSAGLDRAHGEVSTIEDLMRDAWRRIDELGDDPQTLTEFLETFGGLYVDLGLYPEAEEQLELVAALRREKHPDGDAALARAIGDRCGLLVRREDFRGAEACYREALDLWQALGSDPEAVAQARRDLASSLLIQGRSSEAASLLRQVVETRQRASKGRGEAMAMSLADLGTATLLEGDLAGAAPLLERAFEMSQERFGDHGTQTAVAAAALGRLRFAQGRVDEAEALFDTVYRDRLRSLGADHPDSAEVELDLATLFLDQGSTETARLLVSKALPTLKRSLGPASWRVAEAEGLLGVVLLREHRIEQAEPCLRDSLERLEGSLGPRSPFTRQARRRLAEIADRPSPIKTGHGPRRPPGGRN